MKKRSYPVRRLHLEIPKDLADELVTRAVAAHISLTNEITTALLAWIHPEDLYIFPEVRPGMDAFKESVLADELPVT